MNIFTNIYSKQLEKKPIIRNKYFPLPSKYIYSNEPNVIIPILAKCCQSFMLAAQEISDRFKSIPPQFTSKINVDTGDVLSRFDRKHEWKRDPTMARDHATEPRNTLVTTSFGLRLVSHRPKLWYETLGRTSFEFVRPSCIQF